MPVPQGLNWSLAVECFLREVLVVEPDAAEQRLLQVLAGLESMGGQDLRNAAVEALDHAVGLEAPPTKATAALCAVLSLNRRARPSPRSAAISRSLDCAWPAAG